MLKNKSIYYFINFIFILCALLCINYDAILHNSFSFPSIILTIILFILIHIARFIRMYFILLEDLINPNRFVQLYLKTTFVSTLVPFKVGELYKMYCYGVETGKALTGIVTVIIEKFFDAIILCLFMVPYSLSQSNFNPLCVFLLIFIVSALILYFSFEGTYRYLNNFLIRRGGGHKTLALLRILEGAKKAYDSAKHTLKGRFVLLFSFSIIAWGIESLLVTLLNSNGFNFDLNVIFHYISDGFFGITNILFNDYSALCVMIFIPLLLIIYSKKYFTLFKKQERSSK